MFPVLWSQSTPPPIQLDNTKLKGRLGGFFNPVIFPFQCLGEYSNTCLQRQMVLLSVTEDRTELKSQKSEAVSFLTEWALTLIPFAYEGSNLPCKKTLLLQPDK